jgi:hypothetical protein
MNNPYLQQQTFQQQQIFQQPQMTGIPGPFNYNQQPQASFGQFEFSSFDSTQQHQQQPFNNNTASFQAPMVTGSRNPFSQQLSLSLSSSFGQTQEPPHTTSAFASFGQTSNTAASSPFGAFNSTSLSPTLLHSSAISAPSSPSSSAAGQSRPFVSL